MKITNTLAPSSPSTATSVARGTAWTRYRAAAATLGVFAAIAIIEVTFFPRYFRQTAHGALEKKGRALAGLAAYTLSAAVAFDDREALDEALRGLQTDPDFRHVTVRDAAGQTMAWVGARPRADDVTVHSRITGADRTAELALGLSPERVEFEAKKAARVAWAIAAGLLLIGAALASWMARTIGRMASLADEADGANLAKSAFLANMSHELRTPMNGVLGLATVLMHTELDERQRELVRSMQSSGEALLHIIDDILDFSKLEAQKVEIEDVEFDLDALFEDLLRGLAPLAASRNLLLLCRTDPALPTTVRGDPLRLRQILTNLLGNALKFTEKGEVELEAKALPGPGAQRIELAVRDTGLGIDPARLPSLFEPFEQADRSITRRFGGTGLGLAIVRRLVAAMGGDIDVTSHPGVGSRFVVTLPMATVAGPPAAQASFARPSAAVLLLNPAEHAAVTAALAAWHLQPTSRFDTDSGQAAPGLACLDAHDPRAARLVRELRANGVCIIAWLAFGADPPPWVAEHAVTTVQRPWTRRALRQAVERAASGNVELARVATRTMASPTVPAPSTAATHDAPRARVLIVEDHPTNRHVLSGLLGILGIDADHLEEAAPAIQALSRPHPYRAVFMDSQMPGMDGYEATRLIRADEAQRGRPRLPIIAVTAHALTGERERAEAAGLDAFLTKPVREHELRETLVRFALLNAAPAASPPPSSSPARAPAPAPAPANGALDAAVVAVLREIDGAQPGFLATLVQTYAHETARHLDALREGVRQGDAEALRRAAHALKGASRNVGATAVAELCVQIENAAKIKHLSQVPELLAQLNLEIQRSREQVEAIGVASSVETRQGRSA